MIVTGCDRVYVLFLSLSAFLSFYLSLSRVQCSKPHLTFWLTCQLLFFLSPFSLSSPYRPTHDRVLAGMLHGGTYVTP